MGDTAEVLLPHGISKNTKNCGSIMVTKIWKMLLNGTLMFIKGKLEVSRKENVVHEPEVVLYLFYIDLVLNSWKLREILSFSSGLDEKNYVLLCNIHNDLSIK